MPKINIKEIQSKTILVKTKLPKNDYVINAYTGCMHSCKYCYANFIKKFTGHSEDWGSFTDIKIHAAHILAKEMKKAYPGRIMMSTVTDPYNPLERKYKITRKILEVLLPYNWPMHILTKSDLVVRDIDLLKQFKNLRVGFSFFNHSAEDVINFELGTSTPKNRIKALQELDKHNIRTYAFVAPLLPHISQIEPLFELLSQTNIGYAYFDKFNPKTGNREDVMLDIIKKKYPSLWLNFWKDYKNPEYWYETAKHIKIMAKKYNIPATIFFGRKPSKKAFRS